MSFLVSVLMVVGGALLIYWGVGKKNDRQQVTQRLHYLRTLTELDKLKHGEPVILLVELHDSRHTKETYYGHFRGILNGSDEVVLSYGPTDDVQAYFPVQDVLQVTPTTEEGLGKWGTKG